VVTERDLLQSEVSQLEAANAESERCLNTLKGKLTIAEQQVNGLNEDLLRTQDELTQTMTERADLEQSLSELQMELSDAKEQMGLLSQNEQELEAALASQQQAFSTSQDELLQQQIETATAVARIASLETVLQSVTCARDQELARVEELKQQVYCN
jgi:chromosome segregation ATPase